MRIGISAHFWPYVTSGSGQYLRHLVTELARLDSPHECILIGEPGAFANEPPPLPTATTPAPPVPTGRPAKLWFEQIALPRIVHHLQLDLLHVPYLAPPFFSPVPTVVTVHDLIPVLLPAYRGSSRKRAYTWLALQSTRRADVLIAVSEHTRQDTIRYLNFPAERVFVTHEAAAPGLEPVSNDEIAAVHQKYSLPERFILHLGDTDVRKGVHRLFQAFARWRSAHPLETAAVVLAGPRREPDGQLHLDLPALARSLGIQPDVHFLGPIPETDKAALLSAASVLALLSEYEGFGLPPLEAMACGTAVLVGNRTSLPEVVGQAGILVDPENEAAVVEALGRLLEDEGWRRELGKRGLERARTFSWARTARETLAVYESVRNEE
jgi:glycosyltransferase involved in cell wall biosynthesis